MKKILFMLLLIMTMFLSSCETVDNNLVTLPDLTGKSRTEISEILDSYGISHNFYFSDQIIYSDDMLDKFVSYLGVYEPGDKISKDRSIGIYTTVLPLELKYIYTLQLETEYEGKSFINDGIGEVTLVSTTDGDTARFKDNITGEIFRLRFLGVDTPETYAGEDPWGKAASKYTASRLRNATTIVLEAEGARTEGYGRYLGFVWVDGILLNLELIELAYSNSTLSNSKYKNIFLEASINAMKTGRRFHGETDPDYDYEKGKFY